MPADSRAELARLEQSLVAAALAAGPAPVGLDPARVEAVRDVLARKRMRAVVKSWPCLARTLGAALVPSFRQYAASARSPADGGGLADGRRFAHFIGRRVRLDAAARCEIVRFDLRFRSGARRLRPRWFAAAAVRLHRRLLVALYCRPIGIAEFSLPLPRFGQTVDPCGPSDDVR